jgi:hypothetical protein
MTTTPTATTEVVVDDNFDEVLAREAAPSYDRNQFTFKYSFEKLLDVCTDKALTAKRPGRPAPSWTLGVEKLARIFKLARDKSETHFYGMFRQFFEKHRTELVKPLFENEDSDEMKDDFFTSKEKTLPGRRAPAGASGAAGTSAADVCGPVLFFDESRTALATINLPLGEVYRAAVSVFVRCGDDGNVDNQLRPVLVLLYFYSCLFHSLDPEDSSRPLVEKNFSDLCDAAEATNPGKGPFALDGGGSSAAGTSGPENPNPFNFLMGLAQNMGLGPQATDALKGASDIFSKIVNEVSCPGPDGSPPPAPGDIGALIDRFGRVLQNPDIRRDFISTSDKVGEAFGDIQRSSPMIAGLLGGVSPAAAPEDENSKCD